MSKEKAPENKKVSENKKALNLVPVSEEPEVRKKSFNPFRRHKAEKNNSQSKGEYIKDKCGGSEETYKQHLQTQTLLNNQAINAVAEVCMALQESNVTFERFDVGKVVIAAYRRWYESRKEPISEDNLKNLDPIYQVRSQELVADAIDKNTEKRKFHYSKKAGDAVFNALEEAFDKNQILKIVEKEEEKQKEEPKLTPAPKKKAPIEHKKKPHVTWKEEKENRRAPGGSSIGH